LAGSVEINFEFYGIRDSGWGPKIIEYVFENVEISSDDEVIQGKFNLTFEAPEFSNMTLLIFAGDNNQLVHCPVGFIKTFHQSISILEYENSKMKFISKKCFADMENLKGLILSNNEIENIPEDTFWDVPKLTFLNMADNKIKVLPEKLLSKLTNLEHLVISGNEIEVLNENHLMNNPKLASLLMDNGSLTKIKVNFQAFENLESVNFTGNPCTNQIFEKNVTDLQVFQQSLDETCSEKH
jgi:Leucine-rich repeat (LRR) protein